MVRENYRIVFNGYDYKIQKNDRFLWFSSWRDIQWYRYSSRSWVTKVHSYDEAKEKLDNLVAVENYDKLKFREINSRPSSEETITWGELMEKEDS